MTILRRVDQVSVAAIVAVSLLLIAGYWVVEGGQRGRLIDIEQAVPESVDFRIDVNRADWPELTLLPGIGETLARRIVHSRQAEGPFADAEELQRVAGIGPKTVARIRPYLLPLDSTATHTAPGLATQMTKDQ